MKDKETGLGKRWLGTKNYNYAEFQAENALIVFNGDISSEELMREALKDAYTIRAEIEGPEGT